MAIPAFFKIASEVSKAKNVAEGDVTSLATKGIKKFNPDKRIDTKNTEPMKDSTQKFNPDKRINPDEVVKGDEQLSSPDKRIEQHMSYDEISNEQKKCITEFEENHEKYTDNSQAKGNYGEMKVDQDLNNKGLENLSEDRVSDLKTPTGQGIDGVYYNEAKGVTYNVEVKYGTSQLGDTLDGKQMSSEWIDNRLDQAVGKEMADKIRMDSITNPDSVKSVLAKVDVDGNISYFELDANANIIGGIEL